MKNIYDIFTIEDIIIKLREIYGEVPIIFDNDITNYTNNEIYIFSDSLYIIVDK